jgi:glycosyltransferase involved in cell wall biosynthesis
MLGIVIPAHNEQDTIAACVQAARRAGGHPRLDNEPVEVIVVLDGCTDATGVIAARSGAITISVRARNVGVARAVGAEALLARGARWLAFTDADTVVSPGWLADQLSLGVDAVCGTVGVEDWSSHGAHAELLRQHFLHSYQDRDGHRHIHGANLGVSALAYRRAGGFRHLGCSEDVDFVRALEASGAHIAWSAKPRVVTSARREARARGGFADALLNAVAQHLGPVPLAAMATP